MESGADAAIFLKVGRSADAIRILQDKSNKCMDTLDREKTWASIYKTDKQVKNAERNMATVKRRKDFYDILINRIEHGEANQILQENHIYARGILAEINSKLAETIPFSI